MTELIVVPSSPPSIKDWLSTKEEEKSFKEKFYEQPFVWNRKRERAANLLASGRYTQKEVARAVDTNFQTLRSWKRHQDFQTRVRECEAKLAQEDLYGVAIASKAARIAAAQEVWLEIQRFREQRAESLASEAGGDTGLLAETKMGFLFDKSLVDAQIELQKYVAQELGQWTQKQDLTSGGKPIEFTIPMNDREEDSL